MRQSALFENRKIIISPWASFLYCAYFETSYSNEKSKAFWGALSTTSHFCYCYFGRCVWQVKLPQKWMLWSGLFPTYVNLLDCCECWFALPHKYNRLFFCAHTKTILKNVLFTCQKMNLFFYVLWYYNSLLAVQMRRAIKKK